MGTNRSNPKLVAERIAIDGVRKFLIAAPRDDRKDIGISCQIISRTSPAKAGNICQWMTSRMCQAPIRTPRRVKDSDHRAARPVICATAAAITTNIKMTSNDRIGCQQNEGVEFIGYGWP